MKRPEPPEVCPVCSEEVPPGSWACPECGADHNSGWRESAGSTDAVGEGSDEFDYEKFAREEFGGAPPTPVRKVWWITALILLLAFAVIYLLAVL